MNEELNEEKIDHELSDEERKELSKKRLSIFFAVIDALLIAVIIYEVVSMFIQ